ncbi:MAG: hypothetical protein Q8Q52_00045, partial [Acidimicrobiia bacterium]|nr:hypothetical protein [Acidimicrobiia bacterium]
MAEPTTMSLLRRCLGLIAVPVLVGGCGGSSSAIPDDAFPIVANADLAVGEQRLLVGVMTLDAESLAAPDLPIEIDLYAPEAVEPSFSVPGTFVWTVPEVRGLYRAQVSFDRAGIWRVAVHTGNDPPTQSVPFNVAT